MMRQKLMYMVCLAVVLASAGYAKVVTVGTFEGTLDGWWQDAATLSVSATGATDGAEAMQVDAGGGWKLCAKFNAKSVRETLGKKGVKITADVTAFEADMTTTWMQVGMVINGQNNDDNGANNNIGWQDLGLQDAVRDGQPHTMTWAVPDALTAKIAGVTDDIVWFELCLISNLDGASVTKFYIDNIQLSYEEATGTIVVSDFEDGFDGWHTDSWRTGTISLSATGASEGAQAMLAEAAGGWQQVAVVDAKPYMEALGNAGVKITADVTAFQADMTTTWMQVEIVLNCQSNNDNGANNNLGWNGLGGQDVVRDGQPHTLTWAISDDLAAKIAEADQNIGWFEFVLVSNIDSASVAKFYIDNIQIVGVPVTGEVSKSTDLVIGNWEQQMDGWVVGGGADVRYSDTNGVTLDEYSLDVYAETGAWNTDFLTLNLLDPNNPALLEAFKANTLVSVDVTRLVVDWPTDDIPGWDEILLTMNAGGDGWDLWETVKVANWRQPDGDSTLQGTMDYAPYLRRMDFDNLTWAELRIGVNANDADYAGWVWFYLDNMKLSGGGVVMNPQPANGARDVDFRTDLSWTGGMFAKTHYLYVGTDRDAVTNADGASDPSVTFVVVDGNSFDPGDLAFDSRYFWRVDAIDEGNPDSPWTGPVWNFTTARFAVVDNFESYTNDSPNRVFQTWRDGLGFSEDEFFPGGYGGNGTGSAVGNDPAFGDIMEKANPHGGTQAMPMYYDNKTAKASDAVRTWAEPQNWNCDRLTLWVRGAADNVPDRLYVTLKDSSGAVETEVNPNASILTNTEWTEWVIPASDFTTVNLATIVEMTIGIGDASNPKASSGVLYVDDIRWYPRAAVTLDADHLVAPKTAIAPTIDGSWDAVWGQVAEAQCLIWNITNTNSDQPENAADLSARFKAIYDDTNFYVFVEIQDSLIDHQYSDWQGDGAEIYFDGDYSHGDVYDGVNDNQVRITVDDVTMADINSTLPVEGTVFKVLATSTGYNIEAAFPLAVLQIHPSDDPAPLLDANGNPIPGTDIALNNVVGFEMQINDNDSAGGRQTMIRWHSDDNNSYQNPSLFGQARLVRTMVGQ